MYMNSMTSLWRSVLLGALCVSAWTGCIEQPTPDPRAPVRVQAIFDPATSTIPLPNAAAVQMDGTLPKSAAPEDTAQEAFFDWIDDLHGWLPEQPIEVPFNGKLDPSTIGVEDVVLVQIAEDESLTELTVAEVLYTELEPTDAAPAASRITIVPEVPLAPNSRYGVYVKNSIDGENGEPVLIPAGMFFGLNDGPLVDEADRVTIPQLASDPDTARDLERLVRQSLEPLVNGAPGLDIDRKELAAAFTWSTGTDVFTVLDPATATIPLPNTIAMDEGSDGLPTFPAAALDALTEFRAEQDAGNMPAVTAQVIFERYLDELHGWPNTVDSLPIEVPLSGPIDPATITEETVQLWFIDAEGTPQKIEEVTREYSDADGVYKVILKPAADFPLDTDFFAFATRDLKDPEGKDLLPAAAMAMAMQPFPMLDEAGNSTVAQLDNASATAATGVQQVLTPFMELIEDNAGYEYDDLAAVWSFYTWRDPFIVFDPLNGDIPFPNAFLVDQGSGLVNIPVPQGADPLTTSLIGELNTRDGFSVSGQAWVTVYGELDEESVTFFERGQSGDMRGSIAMAEVPGALPTVLDPSVVSIEYVKDYGKIMFRPQLPLRQGTQQVALLTNRLRGTNGLPAKPTPIFAMLASEKPLYEEGVGSLVAQLPESAAPALEQARQQYAALFVGAQIATNDSRDSIVGAFVFNTDDATTPMQETRARVLAKLGERPALEIERACNVDANRDCTEDLLNNVDGSSDSYDGPYSNGLARNFSNLQQVQWAGEFSTVNMLVNGGDDFADWADITEEMRVGVSLFVPKEVTGVCEPPFRVVIAQHGLTSTRLISGMGFANTFAEPETCLAVVAPDTYLHGGRSPSSTTLHPTTFPEDSGEGFLQANFVKSKNQFKQGIVDLIVLNQLVKSGALETLVENTTATGIDPMFDTSEMGIIGTSLGGIFATALTTLDPDMNNTVLTVAPGKLTYYLTEESSIGEDLLAPLALFGLERGTFAFEQLIAFVQWVADEIDPALFAKHMIDDTLSVLSYDSASDTYTEADDVPDAEVFVQMAKDDAVAPNVSTQQLATILDVSLEESTFEAEHAFVARVDPTDPNFKKSECARKQAAFFLRAAIDNSSTELPMSLVADNCVNAP